MKKHLVFLEDDEELVKEIKAYQKQHDLPSFIEAVRRLCKSGISMDDMMKKAKITI